LDGGYDAHIVTVVWDGVPEPPEPVPFRKNLKWLFIAIGIVVAVIIAMTIF
jgi:hypothetical protein